MIAALAYGARVLNDKHWSDLAEKSVEFILNKLTRKDGRLLARYREGEAAYLAYIDDYAFLTWGLIELYETTFETKYLKKALELQNDTVRLFWDKEEGGFFFYGEDAESLLSRPKELYDGAMPSGNSVAALNILRLARLTGWTGLEDLSDCLIQIFAGEIKLYPAAFSACLMAIQFALGKTKEIVLVGSPKSSQTKQAIQAIHRQFTPHLVTLLKTEGEKELEELAPFTKEHRTLGGETTMYICENFSCRAPVTDVEQLHNL